MVPYKSEIFGPVSPTARLHPVYAALVPLVAMMVMALAQFFTGMMAFMLGWSDPNWILLYRLMVGFGLVSLAIFAWVKWVENRALASMGWRFERAVSRFGRGFAIGLLMNVSAIVIIGLFGGYEVGNWAPALTHPVAFGFVALFLVGFIIQGGTEEVLTRGWMLSAMASRFGVPIAVGVTSSLFALLHLGNEWPHINWIAMANIVLIGVFFALYVLRERSLLGACAAHASWNWVMSLGFGLDVSGIHIGVDPLIVELSQRPQLAIWLSGGSFGPEGSIVVTVVILVSCFLVWRWKGEDLIRHQHKEVQQ